MLQEDEMSDSRKLDKIESFMAIRFIKDKFHTFSRKINKGTPEESDLRIDGRKNIYANFDNPELKAALESWAKEYDLTLTFCDGGSIMGDIFFAGIVDRFCFSEADWKIYTEFVDFVANGPSENDIIEYGLEDVEFETGSTAPLIIIDRMGSQNDPPNAPFFHVDSNDFETIKKLLLDSYKGGMRDA